MQSILWISPRRENDNGLCLNHLRPGHFVKQCSSVQRCKKCQKPNNSWLHVNRQDKETKVLDAVSPREVNPGDVATHTSQSSSSCQFLLMTCQVRVTSPDGHTTKTRPLLDFASFASFITKNLVQLLCVPRHHHTGVGTGGAGGATAPPIF